MEQKKQAALGAIRQLIAYHSASLRGTSGYTDGGPLTYITKDRALVALRYGVPIGIRDSCCDYHGSHKGDYGYITIRDARMLDRCLTEMMYENTASIHTALPLHIQKKMLGFIDQIIEIESPELARDSAQKPAAPLLGARGDIYNLISIAAQTLRPRG